MNHSMYSADRGTHLKIVVLGLICATMVAVVGLFAGERGTGGPFNRYHVSSPFGEEAFCT